MKRCYWKYIIVVILFCSAIATSQDDFEAWKKAQEADLQAFKSRYLKEFNDFLQREWQAYQLFKAEYPDNTPKPESLPAAVPQAIPAEVLAAAPMVEQVHTLAQPELVADSIFSIFSSGEPLSLIFFDAQVNLTYDKNLQNARLNMPLNNENIRQFGIALGSADFDDLLDQLAKLKQQMSLNDWGYCLLVSEIAKHIYPDTPNQQRLLTWYLLIASGYDARAGYQQSQVYMLLPLTPRVYGVRPLLVGDRAYYLITFGDSEPNSDKIYTYPGTFDGAREMIALNLLRLPQFRQVVEYRPLRFEYGSESWELSLKLRRDVIDFYRDYPQTDYDVYFSAALSPEAHNSLLNGLRPILEGRPETEATNILLRFVQTAFQYASDRQQFGREKPLFAEETLFYPYSDCEDRAVLFAYLVRTLLGLEVVALNYPGHLATAVKFSVDVPGDHITYNDEKYTICDPTYEMANIGICMPEYRDAQVAVIPVVR